MVDSEFKAKKILKLYFELFLYCYILTILSIFFVKDLDLFSTIKGFFPLMLHPLWFASAYITLMLLKPFLDKILLWNKKSLIVFIILLFISISLESSIPFSEQRSYVIEVIWFWLVYLFIGFIKKCGINLKGKSFFLIFGLGLYSLLVVLRYYSEIHSESRLSAMINEVSTQYIDDIQSLPNFLIAFGIFYFVINASPKHSKIINSLSSSTFSVYIIHQLPTLYPFLWSNIFKGDIWIKNHNCVYAIFVSLLVFFACSIVDIPRKKIIEPVFEKSKLFIYIENKLNAYNENIS